ncbi:hypothetical protein [Myroides fluvii]|uniref:hypothetical protein n=1 Tax=Myroides fluvii TaxID=2572594 RepID=UPI00131E5996|nr:hypothetical protein [Myroides fluvii]
MNTTTLKQVNAKLKQLPETLLEEVERYIDFLTFKHKQDTEGVSQAHQDLVLNRVKEGGKSVDAFEMLDELENE